MTSPAPRGGGRVAAMYLLLVGLPLALLLVILRVGSWQPAAAGPAAAAPAPVAVDAGTVPPALLLLLQVALIVIAARFVGRVFRRFGQPQVVGEMAAGILLGPSLLGWLAPGASQVLFPSASLGLLQAVSQIGMLLFMFLVGLELDPALLRHHRLTAVLTSNASIVAPFTLGAALASWLYARFAPPGVSFTSFALFLGAAMSVTAFPVLARIVAERKLMDTELGAVSLACAAVDDVTAWTILAAVVVLVRAGASGQPLWLTIAGSIAFAIAMWTLARPLLARLGRRVEERGLSQDRLAVVLVVALAAASLTDWLGVHALFGAFVAGAVMPKSPAFRDGIRQRLEDLVVVLLLPVFFAVTGLRTRIGLVEGAGMWLICGAIIAVAVIGKLGGSALAARAAGMPARQALALGVLMNTRGLMELVILSVGLEIGVLSPTLYAMLVLMALVTTAMTTPLLDLVLPARAAVTPALAPAATP